VVEEEVGHAAVEDDDLDVRFTPSSATIPASRRTVSPTMRLTGGFENVILRSEVTCVPG
jgi:hypothetical protein